MSGEMHAKKALKRCLHWVESENEEDHEKFGAAH